MTDNSAFYDDNYLRFLPKNRDAAILDLGCGQGDFSRYLSSLGYRRVTAVDRDPRAIAALDAVPGVTTKVAEVDGDAMEQCPGGWSLIVAKQMLYYVDRQRAPAFVSGLAQSLAADGRLIVEIFNGALLSSRFTELKDPAILTAYTENSLERLLEQNGLALLALHGVQTKTRGPYGRLYTEARRLWFRLYRLLLILERGRDHELPRIWNKSIIAVARRA